MSGRNGSKFLEVVMESGASAERSDREPENGVARATEQYAGRRRQLDGRNSQRVFRVKKKKSLMDAL